jgi:hypothetical protein
VIEFLRRVKYGCTFFMIACNMKKPLPAHTNCVMHFAIWFFSLHSVFSVEWLSFWGHWMSRWPCVAEEGLISNYSNIANASRNSSVNTFLFNKRLLHTCTDGAMFDDCGNCFFIARRGLWTSHELMEIYEYFFLFERKASFGQFENIFVVLDSVEN